MICTQCKTENPAGAKFCMNCGTAFAARCPNCSTELPPQAKFCLNCGQRVSAPAPVRAAALSSAPANATVPAEPVRYIPPELLAKLETAKASGGMRGERRTVTMLFCDIQGSTSAAEKLDPEEWAEIMNGAFEALIAPVYRYEGTLARLLGDAVLAFFGAPIAHEDDPQRAALAALDILAAMGPYRELVRQRWGIDINVRVGINTGLVVVGEVGSDLRMDYTALGDAVNVAARMEQTAKPGSAQVAEDTHRLIAPLFDFEDLGPMQVKGKTEPVHAYRVLGRKAAPGSLRGIEGLESPMVGRDRQMALLREAVSALQQGRGQIVSVMGEAGLGKSRLVTELRKALASEGALALEGTPGGLQWHEGRSFSYETSAPYAPFVRLFTSLFHLHPEQPDAERYATLSAGVEEVLPGGVRDLTPFLASLLGIHLTGEPLEHVRYLEPPQLREKVFGAVTEFLEAAAETQPMVLVFEDVHWVDPTSFDLLKRLMAVTDHAPLMIMAVLRPWRQETAWEFHEIGMRDYSHRYTSVTVEPLDQDTARTLVANLLHVEDLPDKVRLLILTKAEGNPFFVEEVIRSLLDAGLIVQRDGHWHATREIENISVPDTLVGVINARLDRLEETARRVAQTAAVIGREFRFNALASILEGTISLDTALTELQRRELVRERSRLPERVYVFKHALTQETAYSSLLLSKRRDLHKRLAEWLEKTEPESVADIARHLVEAREEKRALPYLVKAGERAAYSYSTSEAVRSFKEALEILERQVDLGLARRAYEGLGNALAFSNQVQEATQTYRRMIEVAQSHGDVPMQVSAMNKLSNLLGFRLGEFSEAAGLLAQSETLATQNNDTPGLAEMHMVQCGFCTFTADFEGAVRHLSEAARIGKELEIAEAKLYGMTHIANTLTYLTRFDDAWRTSQEVLAMAKAEGHLGWQAEIQAFPIPYYHLRSGDLMAAEAAARECQRISLQIGHLLCLACSGSMLGSFALLRGEYENALRYHDDAVQAGRDAGMPWFEVMSLAGMAAATAQISPELRERTEGLFVRMQSVLEQPGGAMTVAAAWSALGFHELSKGNSAAALDYFQKGLQSPTVLMHLQRPPLLIGAAMVALAEDEVERASALAQEARRYVEERGMRFLYPLAALTEGRISMALGHADAALASFLRSGQDALAMGMRPTVLEARVLSAEALVMLGRNAEAGEMRRLARETMEEIARLFQDEKLRWAYFEAASERIG